LLEVEVLEAPQIRYTQDNQTPVAEMAVRFEGLRVDDPPGQIKAVGWGSVAQDLQNRVAIGQRLMLEGRLRMNTVTRSDGIKEKRAEFTLSRFHPLAGTGAEPPQAQAVSAAPAERPWSAPAERSGSGATPVRRSGAGAGAGGAGRPAATPGPGPGTTPSPAPARRAEPAAPVWDASPLVADPEGFNDPLEDDDIPF
jgi:single-stranded DNA-binding protein